MRLIFSVKFVIQKSPNVHKSMLLRGAVLNPRTLNEMDFELMRRHASTHDRIHGLNWQSQQNRDSPRTSQQQQLYNSRQNGNSQDYGAGGQHMKWFPPTNTPGIPPSNVQANQWYHQTSTSSASVQNGGHSSGILRLEDLQAQFGSGGVPRGGFNGDDNSRGGRGYDRRGGGGGGGGSGYYRESWYSGSGSGSGYRDSRR
jgi:hypothetical protein